jgi:hypothetical protein
MSVSQEVTIAFDQMAAACAVIDDDSISFTCRLWYIFLREILLDRDVFQSINAEILIGNIAIRPWYDQDGNFPLAMREAFKWRIDYPEDQDRLFGRLDLIQFSLNVWGPALARYTLRTYAGADQIFINYGKTYAVTGFNLYSYEHS